jgi:hypothetical protein
VARAINSTTVRVRSSEWWPLIIVGRFPQGSESLTSSTARALRPFASHKTWAFVLESRFAGGDAASILREAIGAVGDLASLQVAVEPRTVHDSEFAAEAAHKRRHIAIDQFR